MTIWNKARSLHNRKTPTSRPMSTKTVGERKLVADGINLIAERSDSVCHGGHGHHACAICYPGAFGAPSWERMLWDAMHKTSADSASVDGANGETRGTGSPSREYMGEFTEPVIPPAPPPSLPERWAPTIRAARSEFLGQLGGLNSLMRGTGSVAVDTALAIERAKDLIHAATERACLPKTVDYGQLPAGVSCGSCQCVHEAPACKPFELRDFAESRAQDEALMMGDDLSSHPGSGKLLARKPVVIAGCEWVPCGRSDCRADGVKGILCSACCYTLPRMTTEWPAGTITRDTQPAGGNLTREMILSAAAESGVNKLLQDAIDLGVSELAKIDLATGVRHEWRQHPTRLGLLQCGPVEDIPPLTIEPHPYVVQGQLTLMLETNVVYANPIDVARRPRSELVEAAERMRSEAKGVAVVSRGNAFAPRPLTPEELTR
jgi:hypothetical protein